MLYAIRYKRKDAKFWRYLQVRDSWRGASWRYVELFGIFEEAKKRKESWLNGSLLKGHLDCEVVEMRPLPVTEDGRSVG